MLFRTASLLKAKFTSPESLIIHEASQRLAVRKKHDMTPH
jgi:hypothetical protein